MKKLKERRARIILLHCSKRLAKRIMVVAQEFEMTGRGYAWFVTDDVTGNRRSIPESFPVGLISVGMRKVNLKQVLKDVVNLLQSVGNGGLHLTDDKATCSGNFQNSSKLKLYRLVSFLLLPRNYKIFLTILLRLFINN